MNNEDEINIFDGLIVLAKRKKLIITITLSFAVFSILHSLIKPPVYTAKTIILPPAERRSNMQQLLGQLPGFSFGGLSNKSSGLNSRAVLTEILYTRPVLEIVNKKIRSIEKYSKLKSWGSLKSKVKIGKNKENPSVVLIVSVKDKAPDMAADLANIAVEALIERVQQLAISKAYQKRLFYEDQLIEAKENLMKSEQEMIEFQEKTGILEVGGKMNITIDKFSPELLLKYKRLLRQLKFDEKIFEIMLSQYKSAQLEELEDPSLIQVIEKAIPPKKGKRQIFKKLLIITFAAFLMSVLAAFFLEYIEKQLTIKENRERLDTIKKYLSFKKNI